MKFKPLKLTLVVLFLFTLLVLALPEFSVKIDNKRLRYPSVGFSKIGVPVDFRSFARGTDLFPSNQVTTTINFNVTGTETEASTEIDKEAIQDDIFKVLKGRLNYRSRFTDIEVEKVRNGDTYSFNFILPDKYSNPEEVVKWLVGKGQMTFQSYSSNITESYSDYDVKYVTYNSNLSVEVQSGKFVIQDIPNLVLTFGDSMQGILTQLRYAQQSNTESLPYVIDIDGIQLQPVAHETDDNSVRLIPNLSSDQYTDEDIKTYLQIVQSYFQDNALNYSVDVSPSSKSLAPMFNPEGASFVAVTFILAAVVIGLWIFIKYKSSGLVTYCLLLGVSFLLLIDLAKLFGTELTLGTILAFVIAFLLIGIMIFDYLNIEFKEEIKIKTKFTATMSLVMLITSYFVIQLNMFLNSSLKDINGIFIILFLLSLSNIFLSYTFYRFILEMYINGKNNLFLLVKRGKNEK